MEYRVFAPGYPDLVGVIDHSYGTKLGIMHYLGADRSRGSGDMLDIPSYGQESRYTFRLGASDENPPNPSPTSTPLPMDPSTATPVP